VGDADTGPRPVVDLLGTEDLVVGEEVANSCSSGRTDEISVSYIASFDSLGGREEIKA
jgi:hypothetical protein